MSIPAIYHACDGYTWGTAHNVPSETIPYGVTDDRFNAVSNYYRYMKRNPDDLWRHRDAIAYAIVNAKDKIVRFDLPDPGAGYTTLPKITIDDLPDVTVNAKLEFGTDFATNGSIKSLKVAATTTTAPSR